jgi:conjugative transfer signal peptidase TraF
MTRLNSAVSERRSRSALLRWGGAALACASVLGAQQLRFVLTPSLPRGLYLALPPRSTYRAGDIVTFCPPPDIVPPLLKARLAAPGACPGPIVPLAKRIVALGGFACAQPAGITVGGRRLPWPFLSSRLGLPRFHGCGFIPADCAFVLGDSADSIDSRVFGCVPTQSFRNVVLPLLTERSSS